MGGNRNETAISGSGLGAGRHRSKRKLTERDLTRTATASRQRTAAPTCSRISNQSEQYPARIRPQRRTPASDNRSIGKQTEERPFARRIEAAFRRYKRRILDASIIKRTVPRGYLARFAPGEVITVFAVRIPRLSSRTINTFSGRTYGWACIPRNRWAYHHANRDSSGADQSECGHAYSPPPDFKCK